jgi:plasmid stability protein
VGAQERAQGEIGVLRDLDAPTDGFFFHFYHLYAQIDKRSSVYYAYYIHRPPRTRFKAARENLLNRRRISLAMINWREPPVTLTIDLPDAEVTALAAKARARGVSAEEYARQVLEHDIAPDWLRRSWESAAQAGLNRLSMDEIDAEIAAARKARSECPLNSDS